MSDPDPERAPWNQLPEHTRKALWAAGYTTPEQVAKIRGRELRAIPGIGRVGYKAIREIWPNPGSQLTRLATKGLRKGNKGNKGGRGMKAEVRELATVEFGKRISRLAAIADNAVGDTCPHCGRGENPVTISEQIRAIGELGKYGPGTQHDVTKFLEFEGAKAFVSEIAGAIGKHVYDVETQKIIFEEFKDVLRRHFPRR